MPVDRGPADGRDFAVRRRVRDTLVQVVGQGGVGPTSFEDAVQFLCRRRRIALRCLLRFFLEGRVADEVAGLELLGRLAGEGDDDLLARVVNDAAAPDAARVAAGLVLLGRDQPERIQATDVSGMILRWQARFVAEESSLRQPLMRLFRSASRDERASWIVLQDRELSRADSRAAVLEMLLEAERDPDLRCYLLDALARTPGPWSRAVLRRVAPASPDERDQITAALATLAADADPERVPPGWSARVGCCDGAGSFAVRLDFRREGERSASALFVLNLDTGVREALALSGPDVQRYDELGAADASKGRCEATPTLLQAAPVAVVLGLLTDAERADRVAKRASPRDHLRARRLLDPLADIQPRSPDLPATPGPDDVELAADAPGFGNSSATLLEHPSFAMSSADLLDHPGYAGWFYDAGDHALDGLRIELLHSGRTDGPDEALVTRAAETLARQGAPRRLVRMLRHNAFVHLAAGERQTAELALASVAAISAGRFTGLPLVRRMIRESLHPGHYFFTPVPDLPERHDVAGLIVGAHRPTKLRVLAVDLALILSRAFEVWLSRLPCQERPHSDQVQQAALMLAQTAARVLSTVPPGQPSAANGEGPRELSAEVRDRLRRRFVAGLEADRFPAPPSDPGRERLLAGLVAAAEALVTRLCLGACRHHCPREPGAAGGQALRARGFPAGAEGELFIRTWPGVFVNDPSAADRGALAAILARTGIAHPLLTPCDRPRGMFNCAICRESRPAGARSRNSLLPHGGGRALPVCRRCRDRYRRDPVFRAEVVARQGKLL